MCGVSAYCKPRGSREADLSNADESDHASHLGRDTSESDGALDFSVEAIGFCLNYKRLHPEDTALSVYDAHS